MLTVITGDAIEQLRTLPDESVQCCVTSPPYWALRDYSTNGQLGLEKTPEEYVAKMVEIFREVRRVLRKDGTLWLNLGDSYASSGERRNNNGEGASTMGWPGQRQETINKAAKMKLPRVDPGLKPKDLCGIPWRVAFALQADGWWLRSDIIWAKPNPMPESVTDRPTKAHEYLFLLTKASNYFYDAEAIKEKSIYYDPKSNGFVFKDARSYDGKHSDKQSGHGRRYAGFNDRWDEAGDLALRNKRSVWTVATAPYPEAHFATYPPDLIKPCIMAGTSAKGCCAKCCAPWERIIEKGESSGVNGRSDNSEITLRNDALRHSGRIGETATQTLGWQPTCKCNMGIMGDASHFNDIVKPCAVLDPFAGSGTTGAVAIELGRKAVLIELNPKYCELIRQRCDVTPGLQLA